MAKRKPPKGSDIPEWVVTYGDLMSLLLCFFILLVAFSEPKKPEEFQKVLQKIKEALGFRGGDGQLDVTFNAGATAATTMAEVINRGEDQKFAAEAPRKNVTGIAQDSTIVQEGELQILGGSLAFAPGSADLTEAVKHELRENIAGQIHDREYIIRIVGHSSGTQDLTLGGHLRASMLRAEAVHEYLVKECDVNPQMLRIELAGDMEPAPQSGAGRSGTDRRVQVYATGKTLSDVTDDPHGTGRRDH